ncbi:short-chain fatty acyl-CoA regulator family protein [Gordonia sp. (in: high G+C Gram-positive bacteria)]|uniref:helix-turn-helix domain-containing protein n=1 Tax=Gordonia sp. (in: high G+C Gram-positive bacteria) TaxID=84139 RepID=UPI001697A21C|nr:short-chain fatty acyl-CoA regulator family protein [Gordonia sp. (in: high G+C Gram-positive bacteria)]NLG48277.1 DUF2083 domain-containing protein [Gordonia sp. (in: high G+C Gram-positive bacteria)]
MAKTYVGARLRRMRADLGISQAALARRIDMSTTYVNQLENNQRPITVPVLLTLTSTFDLPADYFADSGDARLSADIADALLAHGEEADRAEITELVSRMPSVGRTLVNLHRRLSAATAELEDQQSAGVAPPDVPVTPFEQVRDYFYDRRNHIAELDAAAEQLFRDEGFSIGGLDLQLARYLDQAYGVRVQIGASTDPDGAKRRFDEESSTVMLARYLTAGQRAFQLATQLALLSQRKRIDALVDASAVAEDSRAVLRVGLANYFAGALVLPYGEFASVARQLRYDIGLLARRFEVGFETVCHRLSTLQRPGDRGIPFIFVRVDRAGNISKRQSATAFHFSRVGGNCPLWVVHDAFSMAGRIHTQVSEMPDGRKYFWLARTTDAGPGGHLAPTPEFAIGLGCDLSYADDLVYATGVDLEDARTVVPIGGGCKVCDRPACPQRAFPMLGHGILIDEKVSDAVPYRPA